jgi:hypothetical protein
MSGTIRLPGSAGEDLILDLAFDTDKSAVNRRPNGTHYRRAKGDHLAALRWG